MTPIEISKWYVNQVGQLEKRGPITITDLAVLNAQAARMSEDPIKFLLSCCWISLGLLYDELVGQGEIEPITKLSEEKKIFYWKMTEGSKFKRIYQCRALWMYELLNATTALPDGLESPGIVGVG